MENEFATSATSRKYEDTTVIFYFHEGEHHLGIQNVELVTKKSLRSQIKKHCPTRIRKLNSMQTVPLSELSKLITASKTTTPKIKEFIKWAEKYVASVKTKPTLRAVFKAPKKKSTIAPTSLDVITSEDTYETLNEVIETQNELKHKFKKESRALVSALNDSTETIELLVKVLRKEDREYLLKKGLDATLVNDCPYEKLSPADFAKWWGIWHILEAKNKAIKAEEALKNPGKKIHSRVFIELSDEVAAYIKVHGGETAFHTVTDAAKETLRYDSDKTRIFCTNAMTHFFHSKYGPSLNNTVAKKSNADEWIIAANRKKDGKLSMR